MILKPDKYERIISKILLVFILWTPLSVVSQQYEHGSIDLGVGAIISIGLQEEVGFDIRSQYTTSTKKTSYIAEYNRFFIRESENREVHNEISLSYNKQLFHWETLSLTAGVGYVGNDYEVLSRAEDTSGLFFSTRNFNHGAELKFRGLYDINTSIQLFVELNLKSFGRRYDTFAFGLTYSLGV